MKKDEGARNFGVLLSQIEDGALLAEMSDVVQKMNKELHELSDQQGGVAKGTLTLALTFSHERNGVVGVKAKLDTKLPKGERGASVFWLTDGGNLSPENPRQQKLPMREVPPVEHRDLPSEQPKTRSI